jgi:hypothetical protein
MLSFFAITCIFFIRYKKERHPRIIRVDTKNRNPVQRKDADCFMAAKPRLWTRGFILDTLVNFLIYIIYYMLMVIIASEAIHSLNASVSEAGLASGLFVLGTLVARLFAGRSVELYGRKKMLYAGILFYLVTTCMYFLVDSLPMMYGVRLLNGVGYGIASTATSTIVSAMIPAERRGEGHQLLCPEHEPGCGHRTVHRHAPAADVPLQRDHPVLHRHGAGVSGRCFRDESRRDPADRRTPGRPETAVPVQFPGTPGDGDLHRGLLRGGVLFQRAEFPGHLCG